MIANKTGEKPVIKKKRGFDFGLPHRTMLLIDHEYLDHLYKANIIGCAYGKRPWEGVPGLLPAIDLVCKDQNALKSAFEHFQRWGCQEDGDVVAIDIMFRADGSYALGIGPEFARAMFRVMPDALHNPITIGATYIKIMDTTHPALKEFEPYVKMPISPILIGGVLLPDGAPLQPGSVQTIPDLLLLLKFKTRFFSSENAPHDSPLRAYQNRNPGGDNPPNASPHQPTELPKDVRKARREILQAAFPITTLRVARSGMCDAVRAMLGYEKVTDEQIVQACANLLVSTELCGGIDHYETIDDNDLPEVIWSHLDDRFEFANGTDPTPGIAISRVTAQVNLDARTILKKYGHSTANMPFPKVQALALKKGFAGG